MNCDELKRKEERKRDAAYDPVQRWLHFQETITWAEENMPLHLRRNHPPNRIAEERKKTRREALSGQKVSANIPS